MYRLYCDRCYGQHYYKKAKEQILSRNKRYRDSHVEFFKGYRRKYYQEHYSEIRRKYKLFYQSHKKEILEMNKKYKLQHKPRTQELHRLALRRYRKDICFLLKENFSRKVHYALQHNRQKMGWEKLIGYTLSDLKSHLESQFTKDINWQNYGLTKFWTIDHKIPQSKFYFKSYNSEEFKRCWALSNLQPLPNKINFSKGNHYAHK